MFVVLVTYFSRIILLSMLLIEIENGKCNHKYLTLLTTIIIGLGFPYYTQSIRTGN